MPIKRALSMNLNDALSTQRSKNAGLLISFIDNGKKNVVPYIIFGSLSVMLGVAIYYFLPLGIVSLNFGMILYTFFGLLMAMMLGLALLASNL